MFFFAIASIFPIGMLPQALAALQKERTGEAMGLLIGVGVWVMIWGGIGCFGFVSAISSAFSKRPTYSLKSVVGPVNLVGVQRTTSTGTGASRSTRTYIQHELHIGNKTFNVGGEVGGYLMQGDIYAVYFINDRDGVMNLYSYDLGSKQTKKLTAYKEYDIKWPSLGPESIVFDNGGLRGCQPLWRSVPGDFRSVDEEVRGSATPHLPDISTGDSVCPVPFSIAFTNGISIDFFSCGY